jgi:uncharacterized protein YvpB
MKETRTWMVGLIVVGAMLGLVRDVYAESLPPYVLLDLRGHAQQMPLSCESRSAVDLAAFWGVAIPEKEFFDRLPKTDNPNTGFVGNVYEHWGQLPPNGYGVHAEPVAALLREYSLPAEVRYELGLDGLRAELAAGRPVIIWATPRMAHQPVESYTASDGQTVNVIRYEHTVIAVGYTQSAVYVVDAGNGHRWVYGNQSLLAAWSKLGQASVLVHGSGNTPPAIAPQPSPPASGDGNSTPAAIRQASLPDNGDGNNTPAAIPQAPLPDNGDGNNTPAAIPQAPLPDNGDGNNTPAAIPQAPLPDNGDGNNTPAAIPQAPLPENGDGNNTPAAIPQSSHLDNATIILQNPPPDGTVRVPMEVRGTVQMPGLRYYEIWCGAGDNPSDWKWVSGPHTVAVQDNVLTPEPMAWLVPGRYTMRIIAYGKGPMAVRFVRFTVTQ